MTPSVPLWIGIAMAIIYLPLTDSGPSWARSGIKTVPVAAFAIAAALSGAPWMLVLALALSALGDFALSRRGEAAFLSGLSAFTLAHVAYVFLFLGISGLPLWAAFTDKPGLALYVLAITGSTEFWLTPYVGRLAWPVRFYALVITAMGLAALTLPLGVVALGAALFIASDVMLAFQLFRMKDDDPLFGHVGWGVWIFYVAGQALILAGAG